MKKLFLAAFAVATLLTSASNVKAGAPFPHCYPCGKNITVNQVPIPDPNSPFPPR